MTHSASGEECAQLLLPPLAVVHGCTVACVCDYSVHVYSVPSDDDTAALACSAYPPGWVLLTVLLTALHCAVLCCNHRTIHDIDNRIYDMIYGAGRYNVSADGVVWDPSKTVRVLPTLAVMGRYQGARTAQLDDGHLCTVCLSVEGGVFVVKTPLALLD